jgi:predicted adenylyl cyclase CyaB
VRGGIVRNVELKARDRAPARTLRRALTAGAVEAGVLEQRDTYFRVQRRGRLKLREEHGQPALLVAYARADGDKPRPSEYELVAVPDPEALRRTLAHVLGVVRVVEKRRRLLLWEQTVRLHLDDVRDLGTFLEIEAVAAPESDLAQEREQVDRLAEALRIRRADLVARSYVDLFDG